MDLIWLFSYDALNSEAYVSYKVTLKSFTQARYQNWQTTDLLKTTIFHNFTCHHPTIFFSLPYDFNICKQKNKKERSVIEQSTEWSKACDIVTNTNSTLTGQLTTEAQKLRGICTTIKIKNWNKNSIRVTTSTEKRDCGLCAETSNDKHSIWRVGLSRSLNVETNKKVLVKVGQASLTVW